MKRDRWLFAGRLAYLIGLVTFALLMIGCAALPILGGVGTAISVGSGAIGVVQRYEDRQVQEEHNVRLHAVETAIKDNTAEQKKIQLLLERLAPGRP